MSDASVTRNATRQRVVDTLIGWSVYPAGDLVAQLITGRVEPLRIVVMALAGGLLYRFEVPWWFRRLDAFEADPLTVDRHPLWRHFLRDDRRLNWLGRTAGAILYFNPLWIARHMLFIRLASNAASLIPAGVAARQILLLATKSFLVNLPVSFLGNYIIQMRLPLRWRFLGSSIFSGILATAYALAYRFF